MACAAWRSRKRVTAEAEEAVPEVLPAKRDVRLESLQLDRDVRERVSSAVEELDFKVAA